MYSIHYKERWHSDGCLLYFRGGHHRNLCQVGCPHPLGVLCYSAMESVVLFLTTDDLKCASCNIAGETELHDEAITVKAVAPTEAHMSAYAMFWCVKPSKGGEGHTHLPSKLPQVGKHHIASMWS